MRGIFPKGGVIRILISYILLAVYLLCSLCSPALGTASAAGAAVLEGTQEAVSFCLVLTGSVCLWSGVMELLERSGAAAGLARLLQPLLRRLFPRAAGDGEILSALTENLSTPAGIRAARGMARQSGGRPSDELCTLVVLNTASLQLLPSTIASVRAAAGACSAFDILPAVWVSSLCSVAAGLLAAALLRRLWP